MCSMVYKPAVGLTRETKGFFLRVIGVGGGTGIGGCGAVGLARRLVLCDGVLFSMG